jgi:hypothetical protein
MLLHDALLLANFILLEIPSLFSCALKQVRGNS